MSFNFERLSDKYARTLERVNATWNKHANQRTAAILLLLLPLILAFQLFLNTPPAHFPTHTLVTIEEGEPLSEIAESLYDQGVISSPLLFSVLARVSGNAGSMLAGEYYFTKPLTLIGVLSRVSRGDFGLEPVTFRIIEGDTVKKIAARCERVFVRCDAETFIAEAESFEGYLFPDTYIFLPNADEKVLVKTFTDTFYKKILPLQESIMGSKHSLHEIVTFASILEKEERTTYDRRMIAGVIENRLAIDMPLQVDATFLYLLGKGSADLTRKDLAHESPYNTYTHKGLPPGPIGSPSFDALEAVLNPTPSKYLFYLANLSGETFYGETYVDHLRNRRLYLNKQ